MSTLDRAIMRMITSKAIDKMAIGTQESQRDTHAVIPIKRVNADIAGGRAHDETRQARSYMRNGAQHLLYNLYLDAGFGLIWGNGTGGSSLYSQRTFSNVTTTLTIFGKIPPGQDLTAGAYTDTITATMEL